LFRSATSDVDVADLLDYFALDSKTRTILLYVEAITDARKFMSAARAAARVKPVVVVKSGRMAQGAKAAATHTGALAGSDAVYDAAFRRAGLLRVFDLRELFDCAELLGRHGRVPEGRNLAILTNGGGLGILAVDRLAELDGAVPSLGKDTVMRCGMAGRSMSVRFGPMTSRLSSSSWSMYRPTTSGCVSCTR
jgi:acetyltransferase